MVNGRLQRMSQYDVLPQDIWKNAAWQLVITMMHDDVIKWKHFPRYWPFVRGIHRWPVDSPHKDQWREALMFSLICAWTNNEVRNRDAGDLRRRRTHYDVNLVDPIFTKVKSSQPINSFDIVGFISWHRYHSMQQHYGTCCEMFTWRWSHTGPRHRIDKGFQGYVS